MTTLNFTATSGIPSLNMISAGPQLPFFFNQATFGVFKPDRVDLTVADSTTGLFPGTNRTIDFLGENLAVTVVNGKVQFTGGTMTDVEIRVGSTNVFDISGASYDFAQFGGLLNSGSSQIFDFWFAGDDTINGDVGDDALVGYGGNSTLNGGGGRDIVFGDTYGGNSYDTASAQIVRMYQATLDRTPDDSGHGNWTNAVLGGLPLSQVAAGFVSSAEFQATYGGLTDQQFVTLLYNNVLDRAPDPSGEAGWLNVLASGTPRSDVVLGFSESAEFVQKMLPEAIKYSQAELMGDFTDDVVRLYQATLDRLPDLGGLIGWTQNLANGTDFLSVVNGFVNSAEFQSVYGALTDSQFVTLLYNNVLNRAPDPGGAAGWEGAMANGMTRAEVVQGFSQSAEFVNNMAPIIEVWVEANGTDDVLDGGAGDDVLVGGLLADEFHFSFAEGGDDVVADFEMWDTIVLDGFGLGSATAAAAAFTQDGDDAVYDHANGEIRLEDVIASELTADEFQIV